MSDNLVDGTLVALAYTFLVVAGVIAVAAVAAVAFAVRDLKHARTPLASVAGPADVDLPRAA